MSSIFFLPINRDTRPNTIATEPAATALEGVFVPKANAADSTPIISAAKQAVFVKVVECCILIEF